MGAGMVRRLLGRGDDVVVWNRTPAKSQQLAAEFQAEPGRVTVAGSPAEVLQACDRTFSMLSTPAAAREVFFAPDGVLAGVQPGKALVDCATLEARDMQKTDQAVKSKGGRFLEAPVSGSKVPAEQVNKCVCVRYFVTWPGMGRHSFVDLRKILHTSHNPGPTDLFGGGR